jgi:hypothetical protein
VTVLKERSFLLTVPNCNFLLVIIYGVY